MSWLYKHAGVDGGWGVGVGVSAYQLDELLVAHLSLLIALDKG